MTLRQRLVITVILTAVPLVAGLGWLQQELRRRAAVQALREIADLRLQAVGRERCETDVASGRESLMSGRFGPHRPGPGPHRPEFPPGPPPEGLRPPPRLDVAFYDDGLAPSNPRVGALEPGLRAALEAGEEMAALRVAAPPRTLIAFRTGWTRGPCAVAVVTGPDFTALHRPPETLGVPALLLLVFTAAVWVAAGPAVRRIRGLAAHVRAAAPSRYATPVPVEGKDEVAELARAFNEAGAAVREHVARLEERDQALRSFLADTTHDVMLPLTVLLGHLTALQAQADAGTPVASAALSAAREEADYVASLLHNLGAAAKLEAGEPLVRRERIDLRAAVERVVERHRPLAAAHGIDLGWGAPPTEIPVHADLTLVEQAVGNLVHNAIRHHHAGGHVAVVLETEGDRFVLGVTDDGPGVPADDLARLGERRFRSAPARQRHPDGRGLGLSIVRAVAERHGWALAFHRPEPGGLRAELRGALLSAEAPG